MTDCYFAVIDKISFDKILKKLEQDILQERIDAFANENQILTFSSKHTIKQLYFNAIFKKCASNEFIFFSGDALDAVYIIKSGQFKLVKEYSNKIQNEDQDEDIEIQERQVLNQDKYFLQLQKQKKKLIQILDLGKGQIFGYEDFLMKRENYTYGIVCKEAGEVIMIRGNDFRKRLMSDKLTMIYLKQQMNLQSNFIAQREINIHKSIQGYTQFYFEQDSFRNNSEQNKNQMITKMCHNSTGQKLDFIPNTVIDKARAQELDDLKNNNNNNNQNNNKSKKSNSKISHFRDELSQEFQYNLAKNYQEKFGLLDLSKLKGHVPQEIVQEINKKLKVKRITKIEKSPPQISSSVLDYIKLKSQNQTMNYNSTSQLSINTSSPLKSTDNMNYKSQLFISTAKIEHRNNTQSLQSSPSLNYINSPYSSSKFIYHNCNDSPVQINNSNNLNNKQLNLFKYNSSSQGNLKSNFQSIQEIDYNNQNDLDCNEDREYNSNSSNSSNNSHRSGGKDYLKYNNYINNNNVDTIKEGINSNSNNNNNQTKDDSNYNKGNQYNNNDKKYSLQINSQDQIQQQYQPQQQIMERRKNLSQNELITKESQQDNKLQQQQQLQKQNQNQQIQKIHSLHLNSNKSIPSLNYINSSSTLEQQNNNNINNNINNNNSIPYNRTQKLKIFDSIGYKSSKNQSNNKSSHQLKNNQSSLEPNINQEQQPDNIQSQNKNQLETNNNINSLSLNSNNNPLERNKIQLIHSDSFDSNNSGQSNQQQYHQQQIQRSNIKSSSNYSSLFKPYTPKTTGRRTSENISNPNTINQISQLNKNNQIHQINQMNYKYSNSIEERESYHLINNEKKIYQQTTTMSSTLGQSKFYQCGIIVGNGDKVNSKSQNNSFLNPSQINQCEQLPQYNKLENQNNINEIQQQDNNINEFNQEQIIDNKRNEEQENVQQLSIKNQIQVQEQLKKNNNNVEVKKYTNKQQQLFKRMLSASSPYSSPSLSYYKQSNDHIINKDHNNFTDFILRPNTPSTYKQQYLNGNENKQQNKNIDNNNDGEMINGDINQNECQSQIEQSNQNQLQQQYKSKNKSNIISNMIEQIDKLQLLKSQSQPQSLLNQQQLLYHKSPSGKKLSLKKTNKTVYKFEQVALQEQEEKLKQNNKLSKSKSYFNHHIFSSPDKTQSTINNELFQNKFISQSTLISPKLSNQKNINNNINFRPSTPNLLSVSSDQHLSLQNRFSEILNYNNNDNSMNMINSPQKNNTNNNLSPTKQNNQTNSEIQKILKRPMSSQINKVTQQQQNKQVISNNVHVRPHSAKQPIDYFQKLLDKKSERSYQQQQQQPISNMFINSPQ